MNLHPTPLLVAEAWLKGCPGIPPTMVGLDLPHDNTTWAPSGFVHVVTVVGGAPGLHLPTREPVVQVDCVAVTPASGRPPWGKAEQLAEAIVNGGYPSGGRFVGEHLPAGYRDARVDVAWTPGEPRRVPGDQGAYARLTVDLALHWVAVPD